MWSLALKVAAAIIKYGSKALNVIKKAIGSLWDSFYTAYKKGITALAKWLFDHVAILELVYQALKAAGLID